MEPYQSLTADINDGPGGKTTAAFFDLDGTIIATHSVKDIFIERLFAGQVQTGEVVDMATMMLRYIFRTQDFEDSLRESVRNMQGMDEAEFLELAEKIEPQLRTSVALERLSLLSQEAPNLRGALSWAYDSEEQIHFEMVDK